MWKLVYLIVSVTPLCLGKVGRWDAFSSKTLYKWSHDVSRDVLDEGTFLSSKNEKCTAIHVNMLARHGARYPSPSKTRKITYLHQRLLQFEEGLKFQDLVNWVTPYSMDKSNQLVPAGQMEQTDLGHRIGDMFKQLFTKHGKHTQFVSSTKTRAIQSSRYFYDGIQKAFHNMDTHNNEINDDLIRFYENCENFDTQIKGNAVYFKEAINYETRPEFTNIQAALKSRLGLNHILPPADVYLIYELCAYVTYTNTHTFWCDLLTDEERLILEYGRDIQEYYARSYGHTINSELACPLISDMFHTMDTAIRVAMNQSDHSRYLAGKFHFGHLGTLLRLITSLGLFDDKVPLRANNRAALTNRQFRTSNISPFSANLAFALYSCGDNKKSFMLKLFVNEKPITIPGCEEDACPYSHVRRMYSQMIDSCSITNVCSPNSEGTLPMLSLPLLFLLLIIGNLRI